MCVCVCVCVCVQLVAHEAVFKWDRNIMDGILDMCRILMELIAERLKQKPVPMGMLSLLAVVLDADANFHTKMKSRQADMSLWTRVLGGDKKVFAQMPNFHSHKDPKGWLVDIMNTVCIARMHVWTHMYHSEGPHMYACVFALEHPISTCMRVRAWHFCRMWNEKISVIQQLYTAVQCISILSALHHTAVQCISILSAVTPYCSAVYFNPQCFTPYCNAVYFNPQCCYTILQ